MAVRPNQYGQAAALVSGSNAGQLADDVAKCVDQYVADPAIATVTLLFPEVTDLRCLVAMALELHSRSNWRVSRTPLPTTPSGPYVAFGVTRDIPFGGNSLPSEALVLGPFLEFPATRSRAPLTAMELFVGVPLALDRKTGEPSTKANVAHVTIEGLPSSSVFEQMWKGSHDERLASLKGVDDPRAKAKVAFSFPLELAKDLGCAP